MILDFMKLCTVMEKITIVACISGLETYLIWKFIKLHKQGYFKWLNN